MAARAGTAVVLLLLTLSACTARSTPGRSLAQAEATSPELADGLASYLENTPEYSDFWAVFLNINNTTDTGFPILPGGDGNYTMLLPNNTVIQEGFAELAVANAISEPDTFFDRLLSVANINHQPLSDSGNIVAGVEEAAGIVLYGFAYSHVLRGAYSFYDNNTISNAPYQSPVNVSVDLEVSYNDHKSDLLAYGAGNAPGPESVYLRAPYGLLNVETGVELPRDYLTAFDGTLLQLVYDVSGIFVFSGKFLPAAVGVDCLEVPKLPASTECSTVKGALAQLAAMSF